MNSGLKSGYSWHRSNTEGKTKKRENDHTRRHYRTKSLHPRVYEFSSVENAHCLARSVKSFFVFFFVRLNGTARHGAALRCGCYSDRFTDPEPGRSQFLDYRIDYSTISRHENLVIVDQFFEIVYQDIVYARFSNL